MTDMLWLFIRFPCIMNAVQFWIVDTIVKVNPALGYHDVKRSSSPSSTPPRHPDDAIAVSINEQDERTPLLR